MKSSQLKYKEVEAEVGKLINSVQIGAKIPSEKQLAQMFSCNFLTVRKALRSFVEDGHLIRRIGSGSFVAKPISKPARSSLASRDGPIPIGVLIHQKSNAYAQKLLHWLPQTAAKEDIPLSTAWVEKFTVDGLEQAKTMVQRGCAAIILPWFPPQYLEQVSEFVSLCPVPVCLPLVIPGLEKNYFGRAERFGESLLTTTHDLCKYLNLLGHNHLAFIGPSTISDTVLQKMLVAYTGYISEHGLQNLALMVKSGGSAMDSAAHAWKDYQGELGIVCYDDEHALRMITAMHKIGLTAPHDFAIIGRNDTEASEYSDPPLSTLISDFEVISKGLLHKAISLANNTPFTPTKEAKARLLVRESCGGLGNFTTEQAEGFDAISIVPAKASDPKYKTATL